MSKVLLVSPPCRIPNQGTLAIATLRPLIEARGHSVRELHGSLLFPTDSATDGAAVLYAHSRYVFGRALTGRDPDEYIDRVMRCMVADVNSHGVVTPDDRSALHELGADEAQMRHNLRDNLRKADVCLQRSIDRALAGSPADVIGFSCTFDDQIPAAVVIARALKRAWPAAKIAFGGAACFEEQAEGVLATFAEVDAVCHTEGESVIVPLVEALGGNGSLADVPGIVWRDATVDGGLRKNPTPSLLRDLDTLPFPDYDGYMDALAESEWASGGAQLFFETSRGCWWGEKSLCTFCGLNAEELAFRSKSPERVYREITRLYARYPRMNSLLATDNILDHKYINTVFPKLAADNDPARPFRLFYEVKANLKLEQLEQLSAGGVRAVQPGIESFSDDILTLMRKGSTAIGQVQFIKWAHQSGIQPFYNVLILNPGEKTESYWEMLELVPFLEHLPPPQAIVTMLLERFSPYHKNPQKFGITDVRIKPFYREVFGDNVDARLAYQFDFDHALFHDEAHLAAVRGLVQALRHWQTAWRPDRAYFVDEGTRLVVVDARDGEERRDTLAGVAARLFLYLDQNRSREAVAEAFAHIDATLVDALLLTWIHRRWVCRVDDRYLQVLPRKGPARMALAVPRPTRKPSRLELVS